MSKHADSKRVQAVTPLAHLSTAPSAPSVQGKDSELESPCLRLLVNARPYSAVINITIVFALIFPDAYVFFDVDDSFLGLYVALLCVATAVLLTDIILTCLVASKYLFRPVFWMDLMGTLSIIALLPVYPGSNSMKFFNDAAADGELPAWHIVVMQSICYWRMSRVLRFQRFLHFDEHHLTHRVLDLRSLARMLTQISTLSLVCVVLTQVFVTTLRAYELSTAGVAAVWVQSVEASHLSSISTGRNMIWKLFEAYSKIDNETVVANISCVGCDDIDTTWVNPLYDKDGGPAQSWNLHTVSTTFENATVYLQVDVTTASRINAAANLTFFIALITAAVLTSSFNYGRIRALIMVPMSGLLTLIEFTIPGIFATGQHQRKLSKLAQRLSRRNLNQKPSPIEAVENTVSWNRIWSTATSANTPELFGIIDRVHKLGNDLGLQQPRHGLAEIPQGFFNADKEVQSYICREFSTALRDTQDGSHWGKLAHKLPSLLRNSSSSDVFAAAASTAQGVDDPGANPARSLSLEPCVLPESFGKLSFVPFDFGVNELVGFAFSFLQREPFAVTTGLRNRVLSNFVVAVASGYHDVAYHSFFHGIDVMQTVAYILQLMAGDSDDVLSGKISEPQSSGILTFGLHSEPLPANVRFAILVAALGHDIGHPGVNNLFLVRSREAVARTYNDVSVLENMHAALLLQIIEGSRRNNAFPDAPYSFAQHSYGSFDGVSAAGVKLDDSSGTSSVTDCHIFKHIPRKQYAELRRHMVKAILGTDMAKHFSHLNALTSFYTKHEPKFQCRAESEPSSQLTEVRRDLANIHLIPIVLHAADISNVAKPFDVTMFHSVAVMEEFYAQGDLERERNYPVNPMFDRNQNSLPKCQIGFINFIVQPYFKALHQIFAGFDPFMQNLVCNRNYFEEMSEIAQGDRQAASDVVSRHIVAALGPEFSKFADVDVPDDDSSDGSSDALDEVEEILEV